MEAFPAADYPLVCAGVDLLMVPTGTRANIDGGEAFSASTGGGSPGAQVRRAALLEKATAAEDALTMFARTAGGPHRSGAPPVAQTPTLAELGIALEAVKVAIGDLGSEQCALAASLTACGWIDVETALGYILFDRFVGPLPVQPIASEVGKKAWKKQAKATSGDAKKPWKEA